MNRYNVSDKFDIWNYSKGLLNKTLEEAVGIGEPFLRLRLVLEHHLNGLAVLEIFV